MKLIISLLTLFSISIANASELRLVKVKELGPMKNKVIFQSSEVKKIKNSNMVRGKLVAQWGTEVFEVVTGFYACNKNNLCKLSDYERIATFKLCKVKNNKVTCSKKISGEDSISDTRDIITDTNPDGLDDNSVNDRDSESDFPARISDEYSDIF